jgi:hypothetical protein
MNALTKSKMMGLQLHAKNLGIIGSAPGGKPWGAHLDQEFEGRLKMTEAEEKDASLYLGDLFNRAHRNDINAIQELHGLVITTTQNFILPQLVFGRFFEIVNLADDESPGLINTTKQEIAVRYISQDNGKAD